MRPVRAAPAPEQFALAVDLGTSGLKVGLVSLAGTIAWHEHTPLSTRVDGDAATQDATRWWALVRDSARRGLGLGVRPAGPGGGGQRHRAVGQHGAGGRRRRPRRTLPAVDGHPGRAPLPGGHRRPGGRLRTAGRPHLDQAVRRGPVPLRGRPHRAHALPAGRRAGEPGGAEPPGGSSSRSTTCPCASPASAAASHASMAGAWLTDNRHLDVLAYDPVLVGRSGVDPERLPAAPPHRHGRSARSALRWPTDLGLPAGVQVVTGTPDLHSAACGVRCGARLPGPSGREHQRVDRCAGARSRRPMRVRQVASVPGLGAGGYLIADNHETGGACLDWLCGVVPGLVGPGRPARLRRGHPAGGGRGARLVRRAVHAVATRRAVAGRRPARPGRVPQPLAHHRPPRAGPGGPRGRGLQQPVAPRRGGAVRQAPARPVAHGRRRGAVGPVVPDPCRRDGPDHRAGGRTAGGQPARCGHLRRPGPRGRAAPRGARAGPRWTGCSVPIPRTGPPTTACTREYPKLYTAQRRMFARLNRRRPARPAGLSGLGRAAHGARSGRRGRRPGYHGRRLVRSPAQWDRGRGTPKGGRVAHGRRWVLLAAVACGAGHLVDGVVGSRRGVGGTVRPAATGPSRPPPGPR